MNNGYILMYRNLLSWDWHAKPEMMALWTTLLLMANYEDTVWRNIVVKRGQLVTTMRELSAQTGIKERTLSVSLSVIQSVGQIVLKRTNKYTLITICNYDSYQQTPDTVGEQLVTPHVTQNVTPHCTQNYSPNSLNNKKKKINKESTLSCTKEKFLTDWGSEWRLPTSLPAEERMSALADQIKPHVDNYGRDMCNAFYRYWVEDQGKGVMRFENVKKYATFQTASRLATWYRQSSGRERSLPPQVEASLPSIDNVASLDVADNVKLSDSLLKMIDEEYSLQGEDGEWYSCLEDLKRKKNSKSERIKREVERKKSMQ